MSELDASTARAIWETQLVNYHGVGAIVFLLWDVMITFGDEVQYIWPQNRRSPTKWVFLFTRYFGLLAQARLVSINLTLGIGTFSLDICRMIFASQVVFGGILMACIQSVLMLRVYALYTQDNRIALAMIALLVAEIGFMPGAIHMTMPTSTGNMCMKPITIRDIALFGVSALLPQLFVVGLTILKFLSGIRAGWGKIPIVSRLVRDDIILVSVILGWVIITASLTSINTMYGYIGYSWLLSIIPCVGCRVVINMQQLVDERHEAAVRRSSSTPQLTSCIFDILSLPVATEPPETAVLQTQTPLEPPSTRAAYQVSSPSEGIKAILRNNTELSNPYSAHAKEYSYTASHSLSFSYTHSHSHSQLHTLSVSQPSDSHLKPLASALHGRIGTWWRARG